MASSKDMDAGVQKFHHPYSPYDIQLQFMRALYTCLENGKVGIFESPTGKPIPPRYYLHAKLTSAGTVGLNHLTHPAASSATDHDSSGQVFEFDLWFTDMAS